MDSPPPFSSRAPQGHRAPESGDAPTRAARSPWTLLARLIRPQGRRGELTGELLTDFPERFHQRKRLYLIPPERVGTGPREVELENFWFLRSRIVLKFQGIDSINEAEGIRGYTVAIPAEERAPLEPGSVYAGDLIGCDVIDLNHGSLEVGEIVDLDRGSSSTELLVVHRRGQRGAGREVLIPLVKEYIARLDPERRRVEMRLPDGLLEINAPITDEEKAENRGGETAGS
ncbi:MAG TPA: ribosome maturation factor RimM [Acidobacteriaceae bacterium]|jgi:16S rRNA processing protein RimM|nr:ribosome maturation factor RimM [Acidobacteriaceae bacterium]